MKKFQLAMVGASSRRNRNALGLHPLWDPQNSIRGTPLHHPVIQHLGLRYQSTGNSKGVVKDQAVLWQTVLQNPWKMTACGTPYPHHHVYGGGGALIR